VSVSPSGSVNVNNIGTYIITYTATDGNGNTATATRTVIVQDTTPPVIALNGSSTLTVPCNTSYTDAGATASDTCAGPVNVTSSGSVDVSTPATYLIIYSASDGNGNTATAVRTVNVVVAAPVITQQPVSRTNNVGTTATFNVAASSCAAITYQWLFANSPIPNETNASLTIASVQLANAGAYKVLVVNSGGTTTSAVATLTVNRLPVANNDGAATSAGKPVGIAKGKLLDNDTDADGDTLTITSVTLSTNGATVLLTSTNVIYTPQPGFSGLDQFSYTISDGRGGTATANVQVLVLSGDVPSGNTVSIVVVPGGVRLRFAGVPGRSYQIQRTPTLSPASWSTITTLVCPIHGIMEYVDPAGSTSSFYRTASVP
jgi:hypothetical protein